MMLRASGVAGGMSNIFLTLLTNDKLSYLRSPNRNFFKKIVVKEDPYPKRLCSLFVIVVSCTDREWALNKWVVFIWLFWQVHTNFSSLNQNMTNIKMQDAYYLQTRLKGTGSVIIIANDQLRNTTSYYHPFY